MMWRPDDVESLMAVLELPGSPSCVRLSHLVTFKALMMWRPDDVECLMAFLKLPGSPNSIRIYSFSLGAPMTWNASGEAFLKLT